MLPLGAQLQDQPSCNANATRPEDRAAIDLPEGVEGGPGAPSHRGRSQGPRATAAAAPVVAGSPGLCSVQRVAHVALGCEDQGFEARLVVPSDAVTAAPHGGSPQGADDPWFMGGLMDDQCGEWFIFIRFY